MKIQFIDEAAVRAHIADDFPGCDIHMLAAAAGVPDGVTARVRVRRRRLLIEVEAPHLHLKRTIYRSERGIWVRNQGFTLAPALRRQGLGAQLFAAQVAAAARAGVRFFQTKAGRCDHPKRRVVGYYVWARLGYDADLPAEITLPPALAGARRIAEVMATPAGRMWWQKNGAAFDGIFDLTPGSGSRETLARYLHEKELSCPI